ncbi:MAG: LCP family protein [Corynebacterium sp.]|nr:LCP family protein [Corynebacterium sp.]
MSESPRENRDIAPKNIAVKPPKQRGHVALRAITALLAASVVVVSGVGYSTIGSVTNTAQNLDLGGGQVVKQGQAADGATDILLVGIDSRTDAQGNPLTQAEIDMLRAGDEQNQNTDTIILIRIPNDGSSASAISIPRDTYIHDDNYGNMKINGVYTAYDNERQQELLNQGVGDPTELAREGQQAGRQALIDAVADLTGITVDHFAEVGLMGFVLMTDAVGGVQVCLNEAVYDPYSGANFHAGVQTLNGADALSFVRQRHGLPRGDLDRIVRQQAYMASMVSTILSSGTLSNPSRLNALGDAARRSVTIDSTWDIMSFATQLQNLAGGNVRFTTIPVTSIDGIGDYGESVVTVDKGQVQAFFQQLLGDKDKAGASQTSEETTTTAPPEPIDLVVNVLNASNTNGLAAGVGAALSEDYGYKLGEVSNAPQGLYAQTQILTNDPNNQLVKDLARRLGGVPVNVTGSLDDGEVVLVTASDYLGPRKDVTATASGASGATLDDPDAANAASANFASGEVVGTPGEGGAPESNVSINAGSDSPRCVN